METAESLLEGATTEKRTGDGEKREREKRDPRETSVLLFPGQGSQLVGMGKALVAATSVGELYERASELVRWDVLGLCVGGPESELRRTSRCQVALYVTSLAAVQQLSSVEPWAVSGCVATAGLSVGEYAALTLAGSLGFEAGVGLVAARGRLMEAASEAVPSGLMSVALTAASSLKAALEAAREYARSTGVSDPYCGVSTHLSTQIKVVGGHEEALEFLEKYGKKEYGLGGLKRLRVSGAFHTSLMGAASDEFGEELRGVRFSPPKIRVHANLDGKPFPRDEKGIRQRLRKSLYRPVYWEQSMKNLFDRDSTTAFPHVFQVGPGSQLISILSRINAKAAQNAQAVKC